MNGEGGGKRKRECESEIVTNGMSQNATKERETDDVMVMSCERNSEERPVDVSEKMSRVESRVR